MQSGQHHLTGAAAVFWNHIDRNPAAVIRNRACPVFVKRNVNVISKSRQTLIHRIVNELKNQVVKASTIG